VAKKHLGTTTKRGRGKTFDSDIKKKNIDFLPEEKKKGAEIIGTNQKVEGFWNIRPLTSRGEGELIREFNGGQKGPVRPSGGEPNGCRNARRRWRQGHSGKGGQTLGRTPRQIPTKTKKKKKMAKSLREEVGPRFLKRALSE